MVYLGYNAVCYGLKYPGDFRRKSGRVIKEHVLRTHGQSQRGIGLRVGGWVGGARKGRGGKVETTVLEQQ